MTHRRFEARPVGRRQRTSAREVDFDRTEDRRTLESKLGGEYSPRLDRRASRPSTRPGFRRQSSQGYEVVGMHRVESTPFWQKDAGPWINQAFRERIGAIADDLSSSIKRFGWVVLSEGDDLKISILNVFDMMGCVFWNPSSGELKSEYIHRSRNVSVSFPTGMTAPSMEDAVLTGFPCLTATSEDVGRLLAATAQNLSLDGPIDLIFNTVVTSETDLEAVRQDPTVLAEEIYNYPLYMTNDRDQKLESGLVFEGADDASSAYDEHYIGLIKEYLRSHEEEIRRRLNDRMRESKASRRHMQPDQRRASRRSKRADDTSLFLEYVEDFDREVAHRLVESLPLDLVNSNLSFYDNTERSMTRAGVRFESARGVEIKVEIRTVVPRMETHAYIMTPIGATQNKVEASVHEHDELIDQVIDRLYEMSG